MWPVLILAVPLCAAGWFALAWCARQALNSGGGLSLLDPVPNSLSPAQVAAPAPPYDQEVPADWALVTLIEVWLLPETEERDDELV